MPRRRLGSPFLFQVVMGGVSPSTKVTMQTGEGGLALSGLLGKRRGIIDLRWPVPSRDRAHAKAPRRRNARGRDRAGGLSAGGYASEAARAGRTQAAGAPLASACRPSRHTQLRHGSTPPPARRWAGGFAPRPVRDRSRSRRDLEARLV